MKHLIALSAFAILFTVSAFAYCPQNLTCTGKSFTIAATAVALGVLSPVHDSVEVTAWHQPAAYRDHGFDPRRPYGLDLYSLDTPAAASGEINVFLPSNLCSLPEGQKFNALV